MGNKTTIVFSDGERTSLDEEVVRQERSLNDLVREAVRWYMDLKRMERENTMPTWLTLMQANSNSEAHKGGTKSK